MTRAYTIASRLADPMRISQAVAVPDRPDLPAEIRTVVLAGTEGKDGLTEALTEGVDGDLYDGWVANSPDHPAVKDGLLRIAAKTEDQPAEDEAAATDGERLALPAPKSDRKR